MNTVVFVNAIIDFSENLFLVIVVFRVSQDGCNQPRILPSSVSQYGFLGDEVVSHQSDDVVPQPSAG